MRIARMHAFNSPLVLEETDKPSLTSKDQVLVRVGAAGLCHSDLHIMQGEWAGALPIQLPRILGHEAAGWIEEVGESVPSDLFKKGDLVAIFGGWGCGVCEFCKLGEEHLCNFVRFPGVTDDGGYAQYILVPSYRYLVNAHRLSSIASSKEATERATLHRPLLTPAELAPLTDAGLTPYRAVKKIRHLLGPGKTISVIGLGGLGFYGLQYARNFSQGARVIGIDRNQRRLEEIGRMGIADEMVNLSASVSATSSSRSSSSSSSTSAGDFRDEIMKVTAGKGVDVVLDCVGSENTIRDSLKILRKRGALVVVGLFGSELRMPLFTSLMSEHQVHLSLWGNFSELTEVIELAIQGKIKHIVQEFPLSEINEAIVKLKEGQVKGRAVIVPR